MQHEDLVAQLWVEMKLMGETLSEVEALLRDIGDAEPAPRDRAATAHFLEDLYMGLENTLVRICKELGVKLPSGASWHIELLAQFTDPSDPPLPALLDQPLRRDVNEYRRFRHLATHGYGVSLEWSRMSPLAAEARRVFGTFLSRLEACIATLPQDDASS